MQVSRSEPISVEIRVRQGDLFSPPLFYFVVSGVLRSLLHDVCYELEGSQINELAYSDDVFLVSSTSKCVELLLKVAERKTAQHELSLNTMKCIALSTMPDAMHRRYKVLTEPRFELADGYLIHQMTTLEEWRYLGVELRTIGPETSEACSRSSWTESRKPP